MSLRSRTFIVATQRYSLEFGQDRHFLKVLGGEARPVDARRCGAGALNADRMGWRRDHTERLISGTNTPSESRQFAVTSALRIGD